MRPEFALEVYAREPADPVLFGPTCAVSGCPAAARSSRQGRALTCAIAHGRQWRRAGEPDDQRVGPPGGAAAEDAGDARRAAVRGRGCPRSVAQRVCATRITAAGSSPGAPTTPRARDRRAPRRPRSGSAAGRRVPFPATGSTASATATHALRHAARPPPGPRRPRATSRSQRRRGGQRAALRHARPASAWCGWSCSSRCSAATMRAARDEPADLRPGRALARASCGVESLLERTETFWQPRRRALRRSRRAATRLPGWPGALRPRAPAGLREDAQRPRDLGLGHLADRPPRRRRPLRPSADAADLLLEIDPRWLRELVKRWARWRMTSGDQVARVDRGQHLSIRRVLPLVPRARAVRCGAGGAHARAARALPARTCSRASSSTGRKAAVQRPEGLPRRRAPARLGAGPAGERDLLQRRDPARPTRGCRASSTSS